MTSLESESDRNTQELAVKVARLKNIASEMDKETEDHNRLLQALRSDFDIARDSLAGSSRHLTGVMSSKGTDRRAMWYVITGMIFTVVFLYYVVNSLRNQVLTTMVRNRSNRAADELESKSILTQLDSFDKLPDYLQSNPYIRKGYRHCSNHYDCLRSLFYLNNETINIWSHLLGAGVFVYFLFRDIYLGRSLPKLSSTSDYYLVLFYTFTVIICMVFSVVYHVFNCVSSEASAKFLTLDFCGIGFGILGCYLCGLHLGFECHREWRTRYEVLTVCLMLVALLYYAYGVRRHINRKVHVVLFVTIASFGFVPGCHWYILHGGWSDAFVQHFLPKLIVLYGILGVGVLVYLTKFPERLFPGTFDFVCASHQLWHIATLAAFIWWYDYGIGVLQYRLKNPCKKS